MFDAAASLCTDSPQRRFSLWWIDQINHSALHWKSTTGIVINLDDDAYHHHVSQPLTFDKT